MMMYRLVSTSLFFVLLATVLGFQNCSSFRGVSGLGLAGTGFCSTHATDAACASTAAVAQCTFNGRNVAEGNSVTAFLASSVLSGSTCQPQTRTCKSGSLSGSYAFASCDVGVQAACLFNGATIASGQTVTGYLASSGTNCQSQARVCTNGSLSGNYTYGSCAAQGAASCLFNGVTVAHGQSVVGYVASSVVSGQTCVGSTRTCLNGALTGSGDYATCSVAASTCSFNGSTVANGASVTAYSSSSVASGQTCVAQTRTCSSGVLSGSGDFATCSVAAAAACLWNGQTVASGGNITGYLAPASDLDQACAAEVRSCTNGNLSGSATYSSCFLRKRWISQDYVPPASKEGISDARYSDSDAVINSRYAVFKGMQTGYKEYNYFWSGFENSGVASSTSPLNCPSGYFNFPANESDRVVWGFHKYRCIQSSAMAVFDRMLQLDALNGIQTGIVFWSAPAIYRYTGCTGAPWGGTTLLDSCVPRDDAMDDFEDAIGYLAQRYNGHNGNGKIYHFIIWNENASAGWFDYSPQIANRGTLSATDQSKWIAKYADMLTRAHNAVQRSSSGVMLDVSTDLLWATPTVGASDPSHIGTKTLIDGLWATVGANFDWSVAVHPYGDLDSLPAAGTYSFLNVQSLVGGYQMSKLQALGLPATSFQYPQAYLIASEQGWTQAEGIGRQALMICYAQAEVLQDGLILSQAHNYFQSVEPGDATGGTSGQGAFFGLLPSSSAIDLSNMGSYATGAAYLSTSPAVWGQTSSNYCCQAAHVGCRAPSGSHPIYRSMGTAGHFFSTAFSEGVMAGMKFEQTGFNLFDANGSDLFPLYRCRASNGAYLISSSSNCEGLTTESVLGYAHANQVSGTVPLYRRLNSASGDHLETLANDEGGAAYITEAILGYVPSF